MDELDRMFRRLVQNIRAGYPEYLAGPFEVGELYQTLIPYRLNRRELGLETNQEYELTLMRLLSGERGYLSVDDALRETMGRELSSPNPDTSAFRAFNSSRVSLSVDVVRRLEQAAAAARPAADDARIAGAASAAAAPAAPAAAAAPVAAAAPRAPMAGSVPEPRAASADHGGVRSITDRGGSGAARGAGAGFAGAAPLSDLPPRAAMAGERRPPAASRPSTESIMASASRASSAGVVGGSCRYCGGTLPDGRRITFCPHCGQNLTIQHCPACSTELEIGWKFCTTCGRSVTAA
jgi:hypothetical protein